MDGPHRLAQLASGDALRQVARRPGDDRVEQRLGFLAGGDDEDSGAGQRRAQLAQQRLAPESGHAHLHEHDVRGQGASQPQALLPIAGFGDDLDGVIDLECGDQPLADEGEVVHDHYADAHCPSVFACLGRGGLLRFVRGTAGARCPGLRSRHATHPRPGRASWRENPGRQRTESTAPA